MTPSRIPPTVRTTPMRVRGTPSKKMLPASDKGDEGVVGTYTMMLVKLFR
jgi:hypothetical protein